MKHKVAADYFHGEEGYNCAQAVLKAYQTESGMSELTIRSAKVAGGGRAPGGICGALYAAQILLGESESTPGISEPFIRETGSDQCSFIKKNECGCRGYVSLAAGLTAQYLTRIDSDDPDYVRKRELREQLMLK